MSDPDLALFGSGLETFTYDSGGNGVGQLTHWAAYGPHATAPTNSASPTHNAQGQQIMTNETVTLAGFNNVNRSFMRNYQIDGQVRDTYYYDIVGTNCQYGSFSEASYDNRGLLVKTEVSPCLNSSPNYNWINETRNVSGVVTQRSSAMGVGAIVNATSNWVYDRLGRIQSQTVVVGPSNAQVAKQQLSYFGNDDVSQLTHALGGSSKVFNYSYDDRHMLANVATVPSGYFGATYAYGLAGRFASANEVAIGSPNGDVVPRNVAYQYAGADPEQVTALVGVSDGIVSASYAYDTAGNESSRCVSGGPNPNACTGVKTEYAYDGNNRLRRALKRINGIIQSSEEYWYDLNGNRQNVVKRADSGSVDEMDWYIEGTEVHYDVSGTATLAYAHISSGTTSERLTRTTATLPSAEYQFHGLSTSMLAAVDQATGAVNASFSYAPYGEVIEATDGWAVVWIAAHDRRFNDKIQDSVSGLAYYGYRYYDSYSMQWTQSDPMFRFSPEEAWAEPRRAQLYTSELQNPIRYIDPDGRDGTEALPTIGAVLGGIGATGLGVGAAALTSAVLVAGAATLAFAASGGQGVSPRDQPFEYPNGELLDRFSVDFGTPGRQPIDYVNDGIRSSGGGGGPVNGSPPTNGRDDVVTSNGQRADSNGNRISGSGKAQVNVVEVSGKKELVDAAQANPRNGKNQAGIAHAADEKDPRHMHPSKDGSQPNKCGGNTHYVDRNNSQLNPNKPHGQPKPKPKAE